MTDENKQGGPAKRRAIDFTNVKEGSGISKVRMPEGDYAAKVVKVEEKDKDGVPMWLFVFQLTDRASATYPYYCKLQENQLWKLRNLLIATGKQVPKKKINVDPNNLVGLTLGLTLVDAEYEGREQSEVDAVFPESELAEVDTKLPDDQEDATELPDDDATDDDESGDLDLDDL